MAPATLQGLAPLGLLHTYAARSNDVYRGFLAAPGFGSVDRRGRTPRQKSGSATSRDLFELSNIDFDDLWRVAAKQPML
jgi:hypothetical protein